MLVFSEQRGSHAIGFRGVVFGALSLESYAIIRYFLRQRAFPDLDVFKLVTIGITRDVCRGRGLYYAMGETSRDVGVGRFYRNINDISLTACDLGPLFVRSFDAGASLRPRSHRVVLDQRCAEQ